jgi:uncharacterized protein YutE (UPF0331/DUF86 family)
VISQELGIELGKAAGMRNILVHAYLEIDWDVVFTRLQDLSSLKAFAAAVERYSEGS